MTRALIFGAWYGDHLPGGEWCAIVPTIGVYTHLGHAPMLPPGEPWGVGFVRCTNVDGFRFAGQAHSTTNPAGWEWIAGAGWISLLPPACGVSPLIYDRNGLLHRSDCGPGIGSQGYRYVDEGNQIVSGDATYGPFHGLFEYTYLGGDVWIGQAAYDGGGVQVLERTTHIVDVDKPEFCILRQLELGDCRFIRANRDGDTVALAFTKPDGVVLIRTTMAELRALPLVVAPGPVPPDHPIPPDPSPPIPEPTPEPPTPVPTPQPYPTVKPY